MLCAGYYGAGKKLKISEADRHERDQALVNACHAFRGYLRMMKTLTVTLEKVGDKLHGSVDELGFLHITSGITIGEIETNLRGFLANYLEHEGKHAPQWAGVGIGNVEFNFTTPHTTE